MLDRSLPRPRVREVKSGNAMPTVPAHKQGGLELRIAMRGQCGAHAANPGPPPLRVPLVYRLGLTPVSHAGSGDKFPETWG
jgi:hypothetical protein